MCYGYLDSDVGWRFWRDVPQDNQGFVKVPTLNRQLAVGDHYLDLIGSITIKN